MAGETAPQPQFHPLDATINWAANHPAKMLILLAMARYPARYFTGTELLKESNKAQEGEPGRALGQGRDLIDYCEASFVSAELVQAMPANKRKESLFRIAQNGSEWAAPFFGALLDLELESDFSSQMLLGRTNSCSTHPMRSPLLRTSILTHVYRTQPAPLALADLYPAIDRNKEGVRSGFWGLVADGLLRVRYKTNPEHRMVKLIEPGPERLKHYASLQRTEVREVQDVVVQLCREGLSQLRGDTLLNEIQRRKPTLALERGNLWAIVTSTACTEAGWTKFIDADRFGPNPNTKNHIEIAPEHHRQVAQLVNTIEAVRSSPRFRKLATAQAFKIIQEPAVVAYLANKGYVNSHNSSSRHKEVARTNMAYLQEKLLGWVSLREQLRTNMGKQWVARAACRKEDPEIFYGVGNTLLPEEARRAQEVCDTCEVWIPCLKWAVDSGEGFGMWGGMTEVERRQPVARSLLRLAEL